MPERTLRQEMTALLERGPVGAREISQTLRISEKEVPGHLEHIARSIGGKGRLVIEPARCMRCGFVFRERRRFTPPGRCPVCRHEGISPPMFSIERQ
ncbi:MAG TPA: transcriptional regulator [Nitrospiria bacterium]|nr:transcriptional regulator [Nitrospiria bacterium]